MFDISSTGESLTLTGLPFSSMVSWYSQSGTSNTSAITVLERLNMVVDWWVDSRQDMETVDSRQDIGDST